MILFYMRIACLVLWAGAALVLSPSFARYVRGTHTATDEYRAAFFCTALLFVGGNGRWLLAPDDTNVFLGLYAFTAALAVYVIILAVQGRQG
jgi:hypothetical protein